MPKRSDSEPDTQKIIENNLLVNISLGSNDSIEMAENSWDLPEINSSLMIINGECELEDNSIEEDSAIGTMSRCGSEICDDIEMQLTSTKTSTPTIDNAKQAFNFRTSSVNEKVGKRSLHQSLDMKSPQFNNKTQSTNLVRFNWNRNKSTQYLLKSEPTLITTHTETRSNKKDNGISDQHYIVLRSGSKVRILDSLIYVPKPIEPSEDKTTNNGNRIRRAASNVIYKYGYTSDESDQSDSSFDDSSYETPFENVKSREFVFFDLTTNEVIEDEDHIICDASENELKIISSTFIKSLEVKENISSTKMKRKLFTPNYDEEETRRDQENTRRVASKSKEVMLRIPIPTFLFPNPSNLNDQICTFLESLDDKLVPTCYCNLKALPFRENFLGKRRDLVDLLFDLYNENVFESKMKLEDNVFISWFNSVQKTCGRCQLRRRGPFRMAEVQLNEKMVSSASRLRDTLIGQLCYAASWIFKENGNDLSFWTEKAKQQLPDLPTITITHKTDYKYSLQCVICNLRSYSHHLPRKLEKSRCCNCHGPIDVFVNKKDINGKIMVVLAEKKSMFSKFVRENYLTIIKEVAYSHIHAMDELNKMFLRLPLQNRCIK